MSGVLVAFPELKEGDKTLTVGGRVTAMRPGRRRLRHEVRHGWPAVARIQPLWSQEKAARAIEQEVINDQRNHGCGDSAGHRH